MKKRNSHLTEKQKKILQIAAFLIFLAFMGLVAYFIGKPMINFVSEPEKFRDWVENHGIFGRIAFVFMVLLQVIVAIIPGEPLEIGAGYAFGAIEGTFLCVAGITLGSIIVFFLVRRFGVKLVEVFFSIEKIRSLRFLKDKKRRNFLTFLVFFLPGTPKDLITYFVGLTEIKFSHFLLIVSLARLPSIITSTMGGNALGLKEYFHAIIVLLVTVAISVFGLIVYNWIKDKRNKH